MLLSSRRYAAMQRQTAVTAFLKSEQLLLFAFSGYFMCRQSSRQTTRCVKGSCHRGARSLLTLSASKLHYYRVSCPANTGHSPNAVSMLGQRRRFPSLPRPALFKGGHLETTLSGHLGSSITVHPGNESGATLAMRICDAACGATLTIELTLWPH